MSNKLKRLFISIFVIVFLNNSVGQTEKIKIKKESLSDSCGYQIKVEPELWKKKMILHSLNLPDDYELNLVNTLEFRRIEEYINQQIEVKPLTLKVLFDKVCTINNYKLKLVEVKKHNTSNRNYQNHIDVEMKFEEFKNN